MKKFIWNGMVEYKNFSDIWGEFKVVIYTICLEEAIEIFSDFIKRVRNDTFVDEWVNSKLLSQLSHIPTRLVKNEGCQTELYHFQSVQVKSDNRLYIMFDFIEQKWREESTCHKNSSIEIYLL